MATGGLYGNSTAGNTVASPTSESAGLYGNTTNFGGTYFEYFIFIESATVPATPTGGSWSFTTNTGTPPTGWSNTPPVAATNPVYLSIALVNSRSGGTLTWSVPGRIYKAGDAATIAVGTTTTGAAGTSASVTNSGTAYAAIFNFTIPQGAQGIQGPQGIQGIQGNTGAAATIAAGTTTTGAAGTSASVTNSGTSSAAIFNFTIPKGDTGATGATGSPGAAATIAVGTTTTGAAGTSASVNNSGTSSAAVFNFTIPKGDTGATGPTGATGSPGTAATIAAGTTTTGAAGTSASVTNSGTSSAAVFNFTIPRGDTGATGATGTAATIAVGTTTTGAAGTSASVTNSGTSSAAVFNFTIPRGDTGATGATGAGVPVGGTTGQVLSKVNSTDYNTQWTSLGTMASQNANAVAITGGTESGVTHSGDTIGTYLDHTATSAPSYVEGRTWYDSTAHALTYYNDSSTATVHIGQDLQFKVINNTGSSIANGSPVYITGTSSGQTYPNIALAKADVVGTANVAGLTNGSIADGAIGYVTAQGVIDNVNTGTFTVGQVLYLSPYSAGQLMNTVPPTGITVQVGIVSYVNTSTGKIYVKQTTPLAVSASILTGQVALANGGTNANLTASAGSVPYSTSTAIALSAVGTTGQVLTSQGASAPIWTTTGAGTVTSVGGTGTVNGITLSGTVTSSGNLTLGGTLDLSSPPAIGSTAANTGAFTTLSASSTVSGTGFSTYLASPPAIGGTAAAAGTFTTLIGGGGSANYEQITGGTTGKAVQFQSLGSDAAVSLAIQSKGTGAIDLAAGSSGVNISNGGTVTAITRTAIGSGYTGFPSIAITAPTTAGGVQATANSQLVAATGTVVSGGTGYTLNDILTVTTSGGSSPITLTVTGVTGGVVTSASANSSALTTIPSGTVSVSGGTGSGATFNLLYVVAATFTITNAGSGYVEQPTVTFSGGGGSGAAAYATVGSLSVIRALGATSGQALDIYTASSITSASPSFRIRDGGGSADSYPMVSPSSALTTFVAQGNANAVLFVGANGSGTVRFTTNGTSLTEQMRVTHTASAVNYVQVTGAATGGAPAISAQGSDAAVGLVITSKGTAPLYLNTAGAIDVRIQPNGIRTFSFSSVTSAVNYGVFTSAAAGFSPTLSVAGTDADINLTLTPKGAGRLVVTNGIQGGTF